MKRRQRQVKRRRKAETTTKVHWTFKRGDKRETKTQTKTQTKTREGKRRQEKAREGKAKRKRQNLESFVLVEVVQFFVFFVCCILFPSQVFI